MLEIDKRSARQIFKLIKVYGQYPLSVQFLAVAHEPNVPPPKSEADKRLFGADAPARDVAAARVKINLGRATVTAVRAPVAPDVKFTDPPDEPAVFKINADHRLALNSSIFRLACSISCVRTLFATLVANSTALPKSSDALCRLPPSSFAICVVCLASI
jgi:hypothetical protein